MTIVSGSEPKGLAGVAKTMHPGGLHESLGIPEGKTIPPARIRAATHSRDPLERKQADLAETFAHHRPGGPESFAHHDHRSAAHHG